MRTGRQSARRAAELAQRRRPHLRRSSLSLRVACASAGAQRGRLGACAVPASPRATLLQRICRREPQQAMEEAGPTSAGVAAARKRPSSPPACAPPASRARFASPRAASRELGVGSPRQEVPQRRSSVNLDEGRDGSAVTPSRSPTPAPAARWSWPPGDAVPRLFDRPGDETEASSDSESDEGVSRDVPCCALWATQCAAARRCVHGARVVRRIHDEDGAAIDVCYSYQRWPTLEADAPERASDAPQLPPLPAPRAVAYKTYDTVRNESLEFLVQTEVRRSVIYKRLSVAGP